jgi:hypothetical protein
MWQSQKDHEFEASLHKLMETTSKIIKQKDWGGV